MYNNRIYENGSIYLASCRVNDVLIDYTYGTKQINQVYKPQYYSWSSGTIGGDLPSDAKENATEIDTKGHPFYLGLDVDNNNKVTAAYVCFIRNSHEYCLKGYDTEAYVTNQAILKEIFGESNCSFEDDGANCRADGLIARAYAYGDVYAYVDYAECYVRDEGRFEIYEFGF